MKGTRQVLRVASKTSLPAITASLLLTACNAPAPTPAATPQAATPPPAAPAVTLNTSYNELMVAWIDNASHVLWDVEKQGFAPMSVPVIALNNSAAM